MDKSDSALLLHTTPGSKQNSTRDTAPRRFFPAAADYIAEIRRQTIEEARRREQRALTCGKCRGVGWVYAADGSSSRCPACARQRIAQVCGLNERELALTPDAIRGKGAPYIFLRALLADVLARPYGWLTLWGSWGTAKSLLSQIVVAEMVRRGVDARFERALQIEQSWFKKAADDVSSGVYRDVPALVLDEAEKVNYNSEWTRARWEDLLDARYRGGIADKTLTIFTLNADPETVMPGAVASRMNDGRFCRPVYADTPQEYTIERWGERVIPGVVQVQGNDARPYIKPDFMRRD